MAKDEPNVSTVSAAYEIMAPLWKKMDTLAEGTSAMREAGEDYLPMHESETPKHYDSRLEQNVLFNVLDLTLRTWVGKPFSADIVFSDDFAPNLEPYMSDIDLKGNHVFVFARDWFKEGILKGLSHAMVDYPRVELYPGRTMADDIREGVRPYLVHIHPEQVIFAAAHRVNGREELYHLRIREEKQYVQGWEEIWEEQIRVYTLEQVPVDKNGLVLYGVDDEGFDYEQIADYRQMVRVELWRMDCETEEWVPFDMFHMAIDTIPLVTFYADRVGLMVAKPPLEDLADLNIRHWQSMSDQISILTIARFPILACAGGEIDPGNPIVIGPREFLYSPDPQSKYYYVEHSGAAISAGRQDLEDLEERMLSYGAEYLKTRPSRETASARNLDTAEATSPLQDAVVRFNDSLNSALEIMSKWENIEYVGTAGIPTDFTAPDQATLDTLYKTWSDGGLSTEAYLHELRRRGMLDDDFDFAKNEKAKESETRNRSESSELASNSNEGNE